MIRAAYPKYRETTSDWMPSIPAHWRTGRLRWIAQRYAGGTPDRSKSEYWTEGTIPWLNSGSVNQGVILEASEYISEAGFANSSARWVAKDALVMALAGQGRTKGMVAQLGIRATANQSLAAIVPGDEILPRFLYWWLTANYEGIRALAGGDLRDGLNLELLGDIACPIPPIAEQAGLARFLDSETEKIDGLIAEQQRLIALLDEKRQVLTSECVTKGLDAYAKTKPSNIEWIGEIPERWSIVPLTRIAKRVIVGIAEAATHAYVNEGVPILRSTNVRPGRIGGEILFVHEEYANDRRSKRIAAGDLVTVRTGNPGVSAVVPPSLDGCQCFTMLITTLAETADAEYYCYWLNSTPARHYFDLEGWGSAQRNISVPILKALPVLIPPVEEQKRIAEYLDSMIAELNSVVQETERAIALLEERRTALITAAVTGQIDVRAHVVEEVAAA